MDHPKEMWKQLTSVQKWNFNPKQPYGDAWGSIILFGLYVGFMLYILIISSKSLTSRLPLLSACVVWTVVITLFILLTQTWLSSHQYSKFSSLLLMPIYVVAFMSSYHFAVENSTIVDAIETTAFLIAVLQASILVLLLHLLSYPIHPEGIEKIKNESQYLTVYLDNWYKGIRAISAVIISYAIGIVVTSALETSISTSAEIINYNLITTGTPGIFIIMYSANKHVYVMSLIRKRHESDN